MADWKTNPMGWLKEQVENLWKTVADTYATLKGEADKLKATVTTLDNLIDDEIKERKKAVTDALKDAESTATKYVDKQLKPVSDTVTALSGEYEKFSKGVTVTMTSMTTRLKALEDLKISDITKKVDTFITDISKEVTNLAKDLKELKNTVTDPETFVKLLESALDEVW